jgi:dephospho-CoA kinase
MTTSNRAALKKMDNFKLIGISGTNGSGKDTIGKILAEHFNYCFISMTDMLREELIRRGLPPEREYARQLSAEWRRQSGLGVLIDKTVEQYQQAGQDKYAGLAVSSLRNPGEVDRVHELGGRVIWVDADPKIRYQRLQANTQQRGANRAHDDQKSFEEFMADEQVEMYRQSDDPATLSMIDVKNKADIFMSNSGVSLEEFLKQVTKSLDLG